MNRDWIGPVDSGLSVSTVGMVGAVGSSVIGGALLAAGVLFSVVQSVPTPANASVPTEGEPLTWTAPDRGQAPVEASLDRRQPTTTPADAANDVGVSTSDPAGQVTATLGADSVVVTFDNTFQAAAADGNSVRAKGSLSYYEEDLPTTLNPLYASTMTDFRTHELIFDRLFYEDSAGQWRSRVVTSLTASDDRQNVTLITLAGIRWHDKTPFEPADICFTVDALIDPQVGSTRGRYRDVIAGCTATPESATIRFSRAVQDPRAELDFALLPAHGFEGAITRDASFSTRPVGTGPMRVKRSNRDGTKLVAFPNAHHSPRIAEVNLVEGGDPAVQVRVLQNGGVHGIVSMPMGHRHGVDSRTHSIHNNGAHTWWLASLNTSSGPLIDVRLREAVALSIGREQLHALVGDRGATWREGPHVPDDSPRLAADPVAVETVMEEAGAIRETGTWRLGGERVVLRVASDLDPDLPADKVLAELVRQLTAAGFDARPAQDALNADILLGTWTRTYERGDLKDLFRPERGGVNPFGYHNAQAEALLEQARIASTQDERDAAQQAWQRAIETDRPAVFLWSESVDSAWSARVRNVDVVPFFHFTEFDTWSLE